MRGIAEAAGASHATLSVGLWEWFALFGLLAVCTAADTLLNRGHKEPGPGRAALQSLLWFAVGLGVAGLIWLEHGTAAGQEYIAGFLMELSMSVDNVLVWSIVIAAFVLFRGYHHTLLTWGVMISIALRIVFITVGTSLLLRFAIVTVALAVFVGFTGGKMLFSSDDDFNLQENRIYKLATRFLPVARDRYGTSFLTRQEEGRSKLTLFGMAVIMVGSIDLLFTVDSIPAVLAVAHDPFVVIASNMMALMGLKSLYFLFDSIQAAFEKLNIGLAVVLMGIGVKMLIGSELFMGWINGLVHLVGLKWHMRAYELPVVWNLIGIVAILGLCVVWSILDKRRGRAPTTMQEEVEVEVSSHGLKIAAVPVS